MSRHVLDRVHDVRRLVTAHFEHPGPPRREEDGAGPVLVLSARTHHARLTGRAVPGPLSRADTARLGALVGTPPDPGTSEDEDEYYAWREWLSGQRDGEGPVHEGDTDREHGESVNGPGVATLQDRALRAAADGTHLERFVSEYNQG